MTDQVKALTAEEIDLLKKWVDENEFKKITPPAWEKWRYDVCRFLATIESMQRKLERILDTRNLAEALRKSLVATPSEAFLYRLQQDIDIHATAMKLREALAPQGEEER